MSLLYFIIRISKAITGDIYQLNQTFEVDGGTVNGLQL
jgi:hypothetical protein